MKELNICRFISVDYNVLYLKLEFTKFHLNFEWSYITSEIRVSQISYNYVILFFYFDLI